MGIASSIENKAMSPRLLPVNDVPRGTMSESVYLHSLNNPKFGLLSPMPLEITGKPENYVATWLQGKIEGEGPTRDEAVEDCRQAIIAKFKELKLRVAKGLSNNDDRLWHGLLHYIAEPGRRAMAPGEDYTTSSPADEDYKGPFFG